MEPWQMQKSARPDYPEVPTDNYETRYLILQTGDEESVIWFSGGRIYSMESNEEAHPITDSITVRLIDIMSPLDRSGNAERQ
jgi:hypothetical protein